MNSPGRIVENFQRLNRNLGVSKLRDIVGFFFKIFILSIGCQKCDKVSYRICVENDNLLIYFLGNQENPF